VKVGGGSTDSFHLPYLPTLPRIVLLFLHFRGRNEVCSGEYGYAVIVRPKDKSSSTPTRCTDIALLLFLDRGAEG
jgi:hypothetical protein